MKIDGRVGAILAAEGSSHPLRTNKVGNLIVQAGNGKYFEATNAGEVFVVANQVAVAVTAALASAYTGLVVGNAITTGKNLVMLGFSFAASAAIPAATAIGIMTVEMTAVTSTLTARNRKMGGPATCTWAEDSCSIENAPVLEQPVAYGFTEAVTAGTLGPMNYIDLDGSLIIPPGYAVAAYSTAALSAAMLFSFLWREVKVL